MDEAFGFGVVGYEELLVGLAPGQVGVVELDAEALLEMEQELEEAHAVFHASADVEGLAARGGDVFVGHDVGVDGVGDMEEVADLLAVSGDGEGRARGDCVRAQGCFAFEGLAAEPADPALVVGGELAATVDGGVAEDDGVEAEAAGVVEHVLVGGTFGAAVGRVELDGGRLVDAVLVGARLPAGGGLDEVEVLEVAVDLVGGGVDDGRVRRVLADGFEDVDGAEDVDLEVAARRLHAGGHGDLAGEVEDDVRGDAFNGLFDVEGVADVAVDELDWAGLDRAERTEPGEVFRRAVAGEGVEYGDLFATVHEVGGEVGADEAGASGDKSIHFWFISLRSAAAKERRRLSVLR